MRKVLPQNWFVISTIWGMSESGMLEQSWYETGKLGEEQAVVEKVE